MRINFPGSHNIMDPTQPPPLLTTIIVLLENLIWQLMMMGGGLIHHSMVSHNNAISFLHQLHKVPIILCPMMEYSTLHLSIIIVVIIIIISNKWNRIHCKEENRKLFLIFSIVKSKVINKIKYLPDIGFNFQHADSPHNFQRGANELKLSRIQTRVSWFFLFFSEPTTQRGPSYL